MKVNTDGVLLGAWADVTGAKSILDVGTGTGVIALMMAQKNSSAQIHAIDIDENAFQQSGENFGDSLWNNRLTAFHTSLQNFQSTTRYDIIISNPPYFVDDQKTENHSKNVAKHSVDLTYADLLSGISRLLADSGKALLVLPAFNLRLFEANAGALQLFVTRITEVIAVAGKPPYVVLLSLERGEESNSGGSVTIQNEDGSFTNEYKALTKEFYLKF